MITVKTKDLLNAASFAASVANKRTALPALNHILLTASNGSLSCFASNLEIFKTSKCSADVGSEGKLGVPAQLFVSFLKVAPSETIKLSFGSELTIEAGDAKANLSGLAAEEFPRLPSVKGESFTIDGDELRGKFRKTIHAASTDFVGRRNYCGIWAEFDKSGLSLASCSGTRLAKTTIEANGHGSFIIPSELVAEVVATDEPGDITLTLSEGYAIFAGETREIHGRLLDGNVPNWRQTIPNCQKYSKMDRAQLEGALKRVMLFSSDGTLNNSVEANFGRLELTLKVKRQHGIVERIPATGDELCVSVNPAHILEAIRFLKGESVEIGLVDDLSPLSIQEDDFHVITLPYRKG